MSHLSSCDMGNVMLIYVCNILKHSLMQRMPHRLSWLMARHFNEPRFKTRCCSLREFCNFESIQFIYFLQRSFSLVL